MQVLNNINTALLNQQQTAQRWNLSMNTPQPLAVWPCPSLTTITRSVRESKGVVRQAYRAQMLHRAMSRPGAAQPMSICLLQHSSR